MKLSEIRELINLVDKSGLAEFEYECSDGDRLVLRKSVSSAAPEPPSAVEPVRPQVEVYPEPEPSPAASAGQDESLAAGEFVITAPMVGTFYRAPAPGAEPFVEVGDVVEPGQTVCIVEAMKLMNEIEAERRGKIVKILVENEDPVEYGQPLFILKEV
ncbi:MAG: acetyl-CoA carboxylase biotin carboxyl carrier protein [Firmicutes bacterium]|nr:acetyl-CoA carboxylase biotin carboxyl carrier protein [Bacillota bacterium]